MTAIGTRELSALVGATYEAGLDPTGVLWPAVLQRLSSAILGGGPVMLAFERRRFEYAHSYGVSEDPDMGATYQARYARIDPVLEPLLTDAAPGVLLRSEAVMPDRALRRTEFYADWLRPRGIASGTGAVLLREGSAIATLFTARPTRLRPLTEADFDALTLLLPHLAAALRTTLRLVASGAARDGLAYALDCSVDGIFLVDGAGRICAANRAAEALLATADGLTVEPARDGGHGFLRAATPAITATLARLVQAAAVMAGAACTDLGSAVADGRGHGALALPRPSGRPPFSALVAPLSARASATTPWLRPFLPDAGRAAAVVVVTDPAAAAPHADAIASVRLRGAYQLTSAEAAVAIALAQGGGLAAVAARQRVSLATVRTQAQAAYRKTGMRGQVGLAHLVECLSRAGG